MTGDGRPALVGRDRRARREADRPYFARTVVIDGNALYGGILLRQGYGGQASRTAEKSSILQRKKSDEN